MTQFVLFAAAEGDGGIADMARRTGEQFGFNTSLFISQTISFLIVAFLLHRFAYRPILKVLEERRQSIAESLANAAKIKEQLSQTETARQKVISDANTEATRLIEEARAAAAKVGESETQRAIAAAEAVMARAREAAALEHARMLQELRKEVGQLVVRTTAQVAGKILTIEDQNRLLEETKKELAASTA
jgi:F-type H+-transporting ATPase subunit b